MTRRKLLFITFGIVDAALLGLLVALLFMSDPGPAERLQELGVARFETPVELDDFQLRDQAGRGFSKDDLRGAWHLLFYGFTHCPDFCPLTMNELGKFYRDLAATGMAEDTRVAMISVDPARDTPEVLAGYVRRFHEDFIGLTGEESQIRRLAGQMYIAFALPEDHAGGHGDHDYVVQHSDYLVVLDPEARLHSIIRSPHTRERLLEAYAALRGQ